MVDNSSREPKRSWSLDDAVVSTITSCVVLAILVLGTGLGWCLGALAGKALELLEVQEAVHYGGVLGGVAGLGCTLYLCLRRPRLGHPGRTISAAEASDKRRKHDGLVREHRGWDHVITDPGEAENIVCPVCDEIMDVERNISGIPGYITFLAGMASDHDLFLCRFRGEAWHQQALKLLNMAKATPSVKLQQMLEEEARAILRIKKSTKESWTGCSSPSSAIADVPPQSSLAIPATEC
jgi:hypothetical protein